MDELEKLFGVVSDKKLFTGSFDAFKKKYENDTEQQQKLFTVVRQRQLFTKSQEEFDQKYFPRPIQATASSTQQSQPIVETQKKKENIIPASEDTNLDSSIQTDTPNGVSESQEIDTETEFPLFIDAKGTKPAIENEFFNPSQPESEFNQQFILNPEFDRKEKNVQVFKNPNFNADQPESVFNTEFIAKNTKAKDFPTPFEKATDEDLRTLNEFENIKNLTDDDISEIDQKIAEEKEGDFGFFGNIKNKVVNTPTFGTFMNPFFSPQNTSKVSDREELISEKIKEKRVDFIDNLGSEKQEKIKTLVRFKNFEADQKRIGIENQISQIDTSLETARDNISQIDTRFNEINDRKKQIQEISNKGQNTESLQNEFNSLSKEQSELINQREDLVQNAEPALTQRVEKLNELEDNLENIGTLDQELDLLKKEYGFFENATSRVGMGYANMAANFKFQFDRKNLKLERNRIKSILSTGRQDENRFSDQVPAQYKIEGYEYNEENFDKETEELQKRLLSSVFVNKEILEKQREKLRPEISVSNINSLEDVVDFTVDGLADNVATVHQLAIPYVGQTGFVVGQQADAETRIRRQDRDNEEELSQINETLESGDFDPETKDQLERRKQSLEKKGQHSDQEVFIASTGMAVSELVFSRLFGEVKRLNIGKRILSDVSKQELKAQVSRSVKDQFKNVFKESKEILKDGLEEGFLDEFLTNATQNSIEKFYLGNEEVNVFDNSLDAIAGGFSIGTVMSASPRIAGQFISFVSSNKKRNEVFKNVEEISELQRYLDETPDLDQSVIDVTTDRINNVLKKNREIINKNVENFDTLNEEEKQELFNISSDKNALEISLQKLNNKKNLNSPERKLKDDIENKIKNIDNRQDAIINQRIVIDVDGKQTTSTRNDFLNFISNDQNVQNIIDGNVNVSITDDLISSNFLDNRISKLQESSSGKTPVSEEANSFANQLGEPQDVSDFVSGSTKVSVGDTDVILRSEGDNIKIESIATNPESRGQGSARNTLGNITNVADQQGKTLELNVVPLDSTTEADRLVEFYESEGFVKDENFNDEDGGRMTRQPNAEPVAEVESDFANIDAILSQPTTEQENVFSTNLNDYTVSVDQGEIKIEPTFGSQTPSARERRNVVSQYLNETNFDSGQRANLEGLDSANRTSISSVIAEQSQNALEVAQQIKEVRDFNEEISQVNESSLQSAVARALQGVQVNQESFSEVDDPNNISDVNPFYFSSRNKSIIGERGNIDSIRESAQQLTNENVSLQDITEFIKNNSNPTEFIETQNREDTTDLEQKFKELVGVEPTESNIDSVIKSPQTDTQSDLDSEVPFQTESNQERISGQQLTNLVDRLKNTGLANDVRILSEARTKDFLEGLGVGDFVQKQSPQEQEEKRRQQRRKAIELRNKLRSFDFEVSEIHTSKTDYGVSTYVNFTDDAGVLREFRISDHPIFNPDRVKNEIQYDLDTDLDELIGELRGKIDIAIRNAGKEKKRLEREAKENRIKEADKKWERIKGSFSGLVFKKATNTRASFPKIRDAKGGIRSNIFREELGGGLYNYEWTEPSTGTEREIRPSTEFIEAINEDRLDQDVKFQKEFSEKGIIETPNGFVHNGIVYLNSEKVKLDTPIHEFGHLWNIFIKQNNTDAYNTGLNLIKDSEYHTAVKNNPAYQSLNEEQQLEEALAQAIGEKGVKILRESKKRKFNSWFKNLFTRIAKGLGIRSLSGEKLANLTLDKFTDLAAAEILSGQNITGNQQQESSNRIDDPDINNIDVLIAEQSAIKEVKDKLSQKFRDRNAFVSDIKKDLVKYIKQNVDSKRVSELQKLELNKLLNIVEKAKTKNNLLKAFNQVNDIVTALDNRIIKRKIDKILGSRLSKKESGRRKANITTEEAEIVLNDIKNNINTPKGTSQSNTTERRSDRIVELIDKRDALLDKEELSEQEALEVQGIGISIDILSALNSKDVNKENQFLSDSLEQIEEIFTEGRSRLKELREERRVSDQETIDSLEEDANPTAIKSNQTVDSLRKEAARSGNVVSRNVKRMTHTWFNGKLSGSLDSIATIISKKGGQSRDDSAWVQFVNNLKRQETSKRARIRKFANKWKSAQKDLFGSVTKADALLNKIVDINVEVLPENSETRVTEKAQYTISQLLNVWQNNHNESLRSGLASNGFTESVIEEIDNILPQKVKDYGQVLFNLYEEMYQDSNEVYKKLNFHSLGKPDFYAGKVNRENVSIQEDTDALLGGITRIGTTGYGSQKERIRNDKPINAVDVNLLFNRHLQESSHYVAFGEIHRVYNKILRDNNIQKAVILNNGINGDQILKTLLYYKVRDIEQGGEKGNRIVDALGRNIARSVLGLKAKIGITQTISILNGSFDLPTKMKASEFIDNYNPKSIIDNVRFLLKNSEYMQNRYDVEGLENAVLGLESIAKDSNFKFDNSNVEAKRRAASRFYKRAIDFMLLNVRYGDMVGVLGATPVYSAWRSRFIKQGLSEQEATRRALEKFEGSVDRAQQSISSFGKSEIQKHPYLRYLMMFATAPIQNFQNANFHRRELVKGLRGQEKKGSNLRNALAFTNYQFAQPMLYTYISNILAGGLINGVRGFLSDEEEPTEQDKSLISSAVLGNIQSIPFIGGILLYTIDKAVLQKEHTFANVIGSPLFDEIKKVEKHIKQANTVKSESSKRRHIFEAIKKTSGLLTGIPNFSIDVLNEMDDVYWNDNISTEGKLYRALGYSKVVIEQKTGDDFRKSVKSKETKSRRDLSPEERQEKAQERRRKAQERREERNSN